MVAVEPASKSPLRALIAIAILLVLELGAIGTIFKHGIDFVCLENWPSAACSGASGSLIAVYCVFGAMLLLVLLKPAPFRTLFADPGQQIWPLGMNLLGVCLTLVPLTFMQNGGGTGSILPAFLFWGFGMGLLLGGAALYLASLHRWGSFLAETWGQLLPVVAIGLLTPAFATVIRPLWHLDTMADITFDTVSRLLVGMGYNPEINVAEKIIGVDQFYIRVAPVCSGIEGIALVTLFVTLYIGLFRKELRFPQVLLLYPIGILTSALFNVVRITVLVIIGIEGNPELAVGGFHSHAGWLLFTIIAIAIVVAAQSVPALQKASASDVPAQPTQAPLPFFRDPQVARIMPFAIFMLSALLASAFAQNPGVVYPLRVAAMIAALAAFWPVYRALDWRIDPVAALVGLAIGVMWIAIPVAPPEDGATAPYGALAGVALIGWFILRGIGTVVLVPIIEELFFRDYLESRLKLGEGRLWSVIAALATAGLFAFLHDRWAEAFVAGLAFSWVMQRRGNVTDAITSHAVANLVVYGVAVATGNLAII